MALHLDLTVRFLDGRYHGRDWPPSPARLFQALVAGARTGAPARQWGPVHQRALEWLERLPIPPDVYVRSKSDGRRYRIFVPNNSLSGAESTKTAKQVAPKIFAGHAPGEPDVVYRWHIEDEEQARAHLPALDYLAGHLRALGWGIDFAAASASLGEDPPEGLERYTPGARGGMALAVPVPGLLSHLSECHEAFASRISARGVNPYTRPARFGQARYRRARSWQPSRWVAFELQTPEGRPFAARWDQTQTVAAWLRHAAGAALLEEELNASWIDSFVLGHTAPDDLGRRLSFVPLPSVGHQHSDGGIRRVLIVEPPGASGSDAEALDLLRVKLAGRMLTDAHTRAPRAVLAALADRSRVLPFYTGRSRVWETVTPMVLHGHNAARGSISIPKTDRLLRQAFEAAGIPETLLREMVFQRAPYWPGCEAAAAIRVPRHLSHWPRVHVRVSFAASVAGPVIAGIGRHYGLGVFAARGEE